MALSTTFYVKPWQMMYVCITAQWHWAPLFMSDHGRWCIYNSPVAVSATLLCQTMADDVCMYNSSVALSTTLYVKPWRIMYACITAQWHWAPLFMSGHGRWCMYNNPVALSTTLYAKPWQIMYVSITAQWHWAPLFMSDHGRWCMHV